MSRVMECQLNSGDSRLNPKEFDLIAAFRTGRVPTDRAGHLAGVNFSPHNVHQEQAGTAGAEIGHPKFGVVDDR